ncbi:hypothetical protein [Aureimonas sp. Leaf324]|uniref:hypothetical protein n=1 Tax=Aureimonas sp. Leaf324 TaxID=1736336 RepID=UPI0006FF01CF|nr:hypothetical protein [Aureimonas sp. Leaf324]KQQ78994.1 hypothetical protein ASF65_14050 [Aureimonas sp. Leaf324]
MIDDSTASRRPSAKKRGSRVDFVVDPFRQREFVFESGLEEQWRNVLIADPRVVELQEQLPPVRFLDNENIDRTHWFDTRHVGIDGRGHE